MTVCFDSPITIIINEPSIITREANFDSEDVHVFNVESSLESEC